jgi:hypothetical protein
VKCEPKYRPAIGGSWGSNPVTQRQDQLMPSKKISLDQSKMERIVSEGRRSKQKREQGYREQALKIFPWICARCGREFQGKRLRELTVHHKDHNHDNNPPDGSNWELLCLYCHDNEHSRYLDYEGDDGVLAGAEQETTSMHKPFAHLETLLKNKK